MKHCGCLYAARFSYILSLIEQANNNLIHVIWPSILSNFTTSWASSQKWDQTHLWKCNGTSLKPGISFAYTEHLNRNISFKIYLPGIVRFHSWGNLLFIVVIQFCISSNIVSRAAIGEQRTSCIETVPSRCFSTSKCKAFCTSSLKKILFSKSTSLSEVRMLRMTH